MLQKQPKIDFGFEFHGMKILISIVNLLMVFSSVSYEFSI